MPAYRRPSPKSAATEPVVVMYALEDEVTITSDDGGDTATINLYENHMGNAAWVQATGSGSITYSIAGGADAALFQINAASGALDFVWPFRPDYEAPADADGNNSYEVIVAASNGIGSDQQTLTFNVYNVNEAPVFTSFAGAASASTSVVESSIVAATFGAVDPEGLANLSYAIVGGADAALFTVNPWNGRLVFRAVPDFEAPADSGLNNVYDVVVRATDQTNTVTQTLAITVTNLTTESTIKGTASSNTLGGTAGSDTIYGLDGGDTMSGLGGDDVLDGGAGADTLIGGAGADQLLGGAGADRYRYDAASESAVGSHDMIFDFSRSQGDRISLTGIDADTLTAGDQNFTFIGAAAFGGIAGQLRYERTGGDTFVYGDVDGDTVADFKLQINGELTMFASDFLL
jgi:Ca2+-binding RTX toxin-like protein